MKNLATHENMVNPVNKAVFRLLGYRLWWCLRSVKAAPYSDLKSLVVIGGSPRSGTTLLRSILGRHPAIFAGPETTLFLHRISSPKDLGERLDWDPAEIEDWQCDSRSQAEFIERCAAAVLARSGRGIWVEKTPHNVGRFGFVRRRFPHAKLVHIVRDGRDVVCSLRRQPFSKVKRAAWDSADAARQCAIQWRNAMRAGLRFRADPAYYELRYEDLVRDPKPTLVALLAFLGLPWTDSLLDTALQPLSPDRFEPRASIALFQSAIGRWRTDLTAEDLAALYPLIGTLLSQLGYD
jgi:hypothetical protein